MAFAEMWGFGKCHRPLFLTLAPLFSAELLQEIPERPKINSQHIMFGNLEILKTVFWEIVRFKTLR